MVAATDRSTSGSRREGGRSAPPWRTALASEPVASVVSSPRIRALDTARAIAERMVSSVRGRSGLAGARLRRARGPDVRRDRRLDARAVRGMDDESDPRAVPGRGVLRGSRAACARARSRRCAESPADGTVVAVTHGGVVRAVLADALGIPDDRIFRLAVDPASLSILDWVDDVPLVVALERPRVRFHRRLTAPSDHEAPATTLARSSPSCSRSCSPPRRRRPPARSTAAMTHPSPRTASWSPCASHRRPTSTGAAAR